jgi:Signal peptide binding domain
MSGKVNDEDMFRLEKRIKKAEAIIACMTEEERTVPDLIARQVLTNAVNTNVINSQLSSSIPYLTRVTYSNSAFVVRATMPSFFIHALYYCT